MPEDKPLSEEEAASMLALTAGIMTALTAGEPNAEATQAALRQATLDRGAGKIVTFGTPGVRRQLAKILAHVASDSCEIAEYMLAHPGSHSIPELADAVASDSIFVEVIVYKLIRGGFVRRTHPGRARALANDGVARAGTRFQIEPAAWLEHVQEEQES